MKINEAMTKIMDEVGAVRKGDRNDKQKFNFRGIDAVVNAVSPALRSQGVVVVPRVDSVEYTTIEVGESRRPMGHVVVIVEYRFIGPEGDEIATISAGEAMSAGDKAVPKAMSVAFRTALLQALSLPTDDPDPDAETYQRATTTDAAWLKDALDGIADCKSNDDLATAGEFISTGVADGKCSDEDRKKLGDRWKERQAALAVSGT